MKLIRRHSSDYNFVANPVTGETFRWGKTFDDDPDCAPWPELADISISNYCTKRCGYCYRSSDAQGAFISLANYELILSELTHEKWGSVFQVAIGGGEPFEHPDIVEIIKVTRARNIIPNLTTNGLNFSEQICQEIKSFVGAVAISVENFTSAPMEAIRTLIDSGIKTNIHFILSRSGLLQAEEFLRGDYDKQLTGLNAVVFLTYKPAGRATESEVPETEAVLRFVRQFNHVKTEIRVGFDACFVPPLLHLSNTNSQLVDSCESGFFSVYIDEKLTVSPCSFTEPPRHTWSLQKHGFEEIWNVKMNAYRREFRNSCQRMCCSKSNCRGACPFFPETTFCYSEDPCGALIC